MKTKVKPDFIGRPQPHDFEMRLGKLIAEFAAHEPLDNMIEALDHHGYILDQRLAHYIADGRLLHRPATAFRFPDAR